MFRQKSSLECIGVLLAAVLALAPLAPCAQEQQRSVAGAASVEWPDGFKLGPGDVIDVFIWEQAKLSKSVVVAPDGTINYPLIGEISAEGRSVPDLQSIVVEKLGRHLRDPQVTVGLAQVHSYRVFVMGEVLRPGIFEMPSSVTVVGAIAMAGGFTPFASRKDIIIYNPFTEGGKRRRFDYESFVRGDGNERDIILKARDTVIVK